LTIRWHRESTLLLALSVGFVAGLIILFHPTGFISLLIPMLWNISDKASLKGKIHMIRSKWLQFLVFILLAILINIIFLLTLNIRPGEISILNIKLPGVFVFGSRYLWNYLFSFEHGLFIYSPLFILAIIGLYFFAGENRPIFYAVFIFCILDLLCETSWSDLGETPIFGQIAFIPAYALIIFPIASFIRFVFSGKLISQISGSVLIAAFILLNIFQTLQFNKGIILPTGIDMTRYTQNFWRYTSMDLEELQSIKGANAIANKLLDDDPRLTKVELTNYNFEDTNVVYKPRLESKFIKNGKMALFLDSSARFSPSWETTYEVFMQKRPIGIRITVSVLANDIESLSGTNLIITSEHQGKYYKYRTISLKDLNLQPGIWHTVSMNYIIPGNPAPSDKIVACVYYTGNSKIYIDDLKYEAFVQN
ncbi:MAG: hypothetical protein ABSD71_03100, partial [Bacteroidales bacterium]